ncbi:uncharacterized protein [Anoplolepis gracilipes]|uniref:uncharacterized protein n=1 Tax=Anoplolepis gracilipes TaxID=354296 RepID=UPI003BA26DB0
MDLSEDQMEPRDVEQACTLPKFSELRPVLDVSTSDENVHSSNDEIIVQPQTAQASISSNKNLRNWTLKQIPDITAFLDSCDLSLISHLYENPIIKQMVMNVPNFHPNIFNTQSNSMPLSVIGGIYSASTSQANAIKQEIDVQSREQINSDKESQIQLNQQTSLVTEYIQKLQATSLQQLFKLAEVNKKQKAEEKVEQTQNNILNIPSVRSLHQQNNSNFMSSNLNQMIVAINPSDLNLQNEQQENESNVQPVLKVEQQVQTDLPKVEKKSKFRAKIGEIKMAVGYDGSTLFYCPECNLAYPNRSDIEQHIQAHLQERKYQCKECGAMLKRKEHLDQHMRGHSDERPFKCRICHKGFKRNEHLTRHGVIHSGNKNFSCKMCNKAFSRKDHLSKHIQTHLGIRKNKTKEDSYYISQKNARLFDNKTDPAMMLKHEPTFLQHLQKNSALLQTFSSLKEQMSRNANVPQQAQGDNTNGNARYLLPS